jgi:hypothetical protein
MSISSVSCGGAQSCGGASTPFLDKLKEMKLEKQAGEDKAAGPRGIDDVAEAARRDDRRVAQAAKADFGAGFDASAPGRRVDITA